MKTKSPTAIRISVTPEVRKALEKIKKIYPTLNDSEIVKLSLASLSTSSSQVKTAFERESDDISRMAAYSVGYDYLSDPEEDAYVEKLLRKNS